MKPLCTLFLLACCTASGAALADTSNQAGAPDHNRTRAEGTQTDEPVLAALQMTLYDVIALRYQVQQAHWNVVGEEFYQLHDVTGDFYESLDALVDMLGEKRLARGAPATAVVGEVARHADLAKMPAGYLSADQLVDTLTDSYDRLSGNLTTRIETAGEHGDLVSQDALIDVAGLVDKQRYILSAHAQGID